jgi:hypothetical protein
MTFLSGAYTLISPPRKQFIRSKRKQFKKQQQADTQQQGKDPILILLPPYIPVNSNRNKCCSPDGVFRPVALQSSAKQSKTEQARRRRRRRLRRENEAKKNTREKGRQRSAL